MENNYRILVVDDEPDITEFLSYNLKKEGFLVSIANNGLMAIEKVREFQPNLILMDIMMPGMDGIETCEKIRELPDNNQVIIAFLTARSEDYSQIAGFEAGGDDYISKPIRPKVLISRIFALLKRCGQYDELSDTIPNQNALGDLSIDIEKFLVIHKGVTIMLPRKEFYLLQLLTSKPMKVFTREEIFDHIWGSEIFVGDRTIDVYIRKLREKLGDNYIKTIKGVGYKFDPMIH
jgi:two-component system, OmpR family, alkaline phosphatase synthesis response regulator PhoP